MNDPIAIFNKWWKLALADSPLQQKSAVCISTIDFDGFPQGRFVDLKAVNEQGFIFCSYFDSNKGKQLAKTPKASLTAWWDHVGYQVRVVGSIETIPDVAARKFWQSRSRDAQIATTCFEQSQPISPESELLENFEKKQGELEGNAVEMPSNWGGYQITPHTIEFLTFNENRLHLRELYTNDSGSWQRSLLQP